MSTPDATPVQTAVADSADAADLFGTAPALLLELQDSLGALAASATRLTERGRRPFRADDDWARALAELAFRVYLLADQTGVGLDDRIRAVARDVAARAATQAPPADDDAWPVKG